MRFEIGNAGWVRVEGDHDEDLGIPGRLYVRVQEVDGELRVTELYLDGRGAPLPAQALRRLPLQAFEHGAADDHTRARLSVPGPDLSRLAAHFATTFGKSTSWVADSMRAQIAGSGVRQEPMPRERERPEAASRLALTLPEDGKLTDGFLREVATAYDAAVARRLPPAKALAELAGVSPRTVHRWVYTARQRGLMSPARSRGRIV